ncbi:hypothetical protein IC757_14215 [Wenzhouxiangella sp. AB-CW3]|uniref:hypothetical protein n=1 Tax=Wenzhouxiangella sp. AB-CW3 TaxID=2771012 RepID=UPI00168B6889|nr:hypothetical protein [Wenzhouxiangella sp. AB-CW3]QOC22158.1 hypothetical protein IC757_14215 [Wenzhouxiangella sp. AB-CW3]
MNLGRILEYLVARGRALSYLMLIVMAALVVIDIIVPAPYTRFPWDGIGGFAALYGLLSCVLIIVIAKALGKGLLYREEDYYDDD